MALKVLSALDTAKTQLYHFKAIIIAGMGLFTDAYDLFCITPIMILIGRVYYEKEPVNKKYVIPPIVVSTMVAVALLGTAIGQLVFGRLGDKIEDPTPKEADLAWRLILMIGAIPAGLTFYWRMMMPETARYTALVEQNVVQAAMDMEKVLELPMSQIVEDELLSPIPPPYPLHSKQFFRRHGRDLFSCSFTWFLLDIVFYSSNLFQSHIYIQLLPKIEKMNAYRHAFEVAKFQAIIAACSTIPGYWFTVYFIDRIGRVKIQMMGFFFMALVFLALGIPYYEYWDKEMNNSKPNKGFLVLYGLAFFFSNFGPNTTTFIVPAELFPARYRSTCHGISGAIGKVGAIIGSVGFLWASNGEKETKKEEGYPKALGMTASLIILAGVCLLGMAVTFFYTRETMGRSLEENENDD
ncbi:hypothetical protein SO802_003811 [Lithocarpus litseifolius]|uniref:Major facilitator superfamily (MFS) profile domain-containing protein n=1 Tax=Lithocarpus litseifolius TaxID=425828 RepID=A0AAW2E3R5_9ROSI